MKKLTALILLFMLLTGLIGCDRSPEFEQPLNFYYQNIDLSYDETCTAVLPETREGAQLHSTQEILNLYFAGPVSDSLATPFPAGLRLVSCQLDGKNLYLTVSDELAALSGMELTMACCCITLTCLSITDAENVTIQAESAMLGNQETITMNKDALLMLDPGK